MQDFVGTGLLAGTMGYCTREVWPSEVHFTCNIFKFCIGKVLGVLRYFHVACVCGSGFRNVYEYYRINTMLYVIPIRQSATANTY